MKSKTPKKLRFAPLQTFELVPITDPDEIAAVELRIRKAEKRLARKETGKNKKTRSRKS